MNRLYFVRHGENLANLTLEFSHRKVDYSLTAKGILQAQQTAEYFRDQGIDAVFTSPLKRAVETAQIIGGTLGLPVTVVEDFREVNVGDLEGQKPTAALWEQHNGVLAAWMSGRLEERFPGGENYHELLARARAGLEEILAGKEGRGLLIVGHGGIFTSILRRMFEGIDPAAVVGMPNCSITEVEAHLQDGRLQGRLVSYASVQHLSGEAALLARGSPEKDTFKPDPQT